FLPGLEIGPCDRCTWLDPFDALQLCDVVQDGGCKDPVLPVHHAAFDAACFRCDVVLCGNAVVHLTVLDEVTPAVDVRDREPVIAHRIRVCRPSFGDRVGRPA